MPHAKDHSQAAASSQQADDLGTTGPDPGSLSAAGDAAISRQATDEKSDPLTTLRKLLGPEIADVVFATITPDELLKWGKTISDSALKQAQSALATQLEGPQKKGAKPDGLEQYFATSTADFMMTGVKADTAAFLASPEGAKVASAIADKLHGSSAVTITSILAAAAYLATSELKTPDIKKTLGGGFAVSGSADFGKIQHLALQSIGAQLSWKGGSVDASVGVTALGGKAAGDELGGKAKAKLTSGHVGDATTVEKLQAAVGWKVDDHLSMKLSDTDDIQGGRLIKGSLGASATYQVSDHAQLAASIDEQYAGEHTGIAAKVQFTMDVDHGNGKLGFEGSYDKEKGSFFGVVFKRSF